EPDVADVDRHRAGRKTDGHSGNDPGTSGPVLRQGGGVAEQTVRSRRRRPVRPGETLLRPNAPEIMGDDTTTLLKKRAPTLYVIIVIKLLKGILLMLLGLGVYSLLDNNLPEEFRHLLEIFHLDPEKKFFSDLTERIANITPTDV